VQATGSLSTVLAALIALCAGCATVPPVQQSFTAGRDGSPVGRPLPCTGDIVLADPTAAPHPMPEPTFRVLSWNLHKNSDPGWEADLARFAADADLLLLQEAALTAGLRRVLESAGVDWLLASSFELGGHETGVLSAARVRPAHACAQRSFEPLLQLPKSAAITRYEIRGRSDKLAVANVHAINFALGLEAYRAQLETIALELAGHRGPVIFAGDFNTWSLERLEVVKDVVRGMGLVPVLPAVDTRSRFLGQQVDHIFVRGLDVLEARAPQVGSSDHNPVLATLRLSASDAP